MESGPTREVTNTGRLGRKLGLLVAGSVGGAGLGLVVLTFPFLIPAVRRYCLPYVPATDAQVACVLSQLRGRSGKVVDLGSGDGRVVIAAAKAGHYAAGIELNPWLVLYSRWRAYKAGVYKAAKFYRRDLWKVDLKDFDNIIFFGVEQMMKPLGSKINETAPAGARVIACRFQFPEWTPTVGFDMGSNSVWVYDGIPKGPLTVVHDTSSRVFK